MQTIAEVMTRDVMTVAPDDNLRLAAQMMDDLNVGALPVCEGRRLVGIITDRDITVRATSAGESPDDTLVEEIMSEDVRWCFDDQTVEEVLHEMSGTQIRRVPVIDHNTKHLVGIVSLGDLAADQAGNVERALRNISTPAEPDRSPPHS